MFGTVHRTPQPVSRSEVKEPTTTWNRRKQRRYLFDRKLGDNLDFDNMRMGF
jgi:hypothetical protein